MKRLLYGIASLVLLATACGDDKEPTQTPQPNPEPLPDMEVFYKGTTMSFANYLIDCGLEYREDGAIKSPYSSIKEHGANIVRLQLDRQPFAEFEGVTIDWQQWERVVEDAKCAKAEGLEIMLTLKPDYDKYSASSTSHNHIPEDWKSLSEEELGEALYDWVYNSLDALHAEGITPKIVAVGNEVNIGFLLNGANDATRTGRLLNYGHNAVRDFADDKEVDIISAVHIANPSKALNYILSFHNAGATNYDVVALSWYPGSDIGHSMGTYHNFTEMGNAFKNNYGKRIMILETAYSFTTGTVDGTWMGDWCSNAYNYPNWDDATNATNYTPAKQREWLRSLAEDVKAGGGIGVITWGTESLPDLLEGEEQGHGLGIYTYPATWGYGSTWENNSYWDFTNQNNLHEGIDWMQDVE